MYRNTKFMKNPATSHLRIYIGNIAEDVVHNDLEEKFKVHGPVQGLILQKGFGFIQFETEEQAQAAIAKEHGSMFHGRKLNVKPIIDQSKKKQHNKQEQADKATTDNHNDNSRPSGPLPPPERDNTVEIEPPEKKKRPPFNDGRMGPRHDNRNSRFSDNYNRDSFYAMDEYQPRFEPPPAMERPERNDCEIIVVSKILTEYAEYIEQRLKAMNLIVDLLFPNEDVPIGRVLANISSRGCLYAILVMPSNEENRSLTLNILHGVPQEHRNMPIEDALLFITRNFDAYMRGEKIAYTNSGKMTILDRHPENIQMLINLVAENRMLTVPQYDKLIKYLQERRELQVVHDGGESTEPPVDGKAAELQNRILNILNKSQTNNEESKTSSSTPSSSSVPGPTPLLNDPSVQKALDSLLMGDLLKKMTS